MQLPIFIGGCDCATALLGTAIFLGIVLFLKSKRPKNFPPGPRGLPIVGYIPSLGDNGAEKLRQLKGKYGPVMSVRMGRDDWIILNDYKSINEALVKQGEKFSGRPNNFMFKFLSQGQGIVSVDYGPIWKKLRRFGIMTLRGFGVGKKGMEENVIEEMPYLINNLTTEGKESTLLKLSLAVSNIICRVVFGSRFEYDDMRFNTLVGIIREFFSDNFTTRLFGLISLAPGLRFIPPFSGALRKLVRELEIFHDILREIIKEHKASFDENHIRDFIDAFLKEMKDRGKDDPAFCEKQLLHLIRDLFEAGTGTTGSTLSWAILCFANYPECQEKIHEEIENTLGDSGIPTMKHRDRMPYTCAFIQELMRHRTLVPLSLIHNTNKEATLNGFTIPKNTMLAPNLWSVHFDPDLFEDPEEFRPERFLDSEGKFFTSKHVIPFSVGPRHCLGEQLAKMEIFIFLTGMVQKLRVVPDTAHPPPPFEKGCFSPITHEPLSFEVKFEKR